MGEYVKHNFVAAGMCADFAIHDKQDGNPHAHIMLTMRPFDEGGAWGAKQKKEYILDKDGNKIYDPKKRQYKCKSIPATDWNEQTKAEEWRAAWAEICNRALEQNGHAERIDHRSYERQGIEQIPTVHLGVAAFQMERRGIATERGNINREVRSANQELRQLRARINKLKKWLADELKTEHQIDDLSHPIPSINLIETLTGILEKPEEKTRWKKIADLKTFAKALAFLQSNGITDLPQLQQKVSSLRNKYDTVSGAIKKAERRLNTLDKHIQQAETYLKHRDVYRRYKAEKPKKQEGFYEKHSAEIILFESSERYLKQHLNGHTALPIKAWRAEVAKLTAEKGSLYQQFYALKEEVSKVEVIKRNVEAALLRDGPDVKKKRSQEAELD